MAIKYPTTNKKYTTIATSSNPQKLSSSASGRGMSLESLLNLSNEYYLTHQLACVYKKPTPIQVVKVDYKTRQTAKIVEAYYSTSSTTDYNGVINGQYIDFEAKQTNLKALPLHNFHEHQIKHMENVLAQKGTAFVIIYYKKHERFFLLLAKDIIRIYRAYFAGGTVNSISLQLAEEIGYEIPSNSYPIVHYLPIIQQFI